MCPPILIHFWGYFWEEFNKKKFFLFGGGWDHFWRTQHFDHLLCCPFTLALYNLFTENWQKSHELTCACYSFNFAFVIFWPSFHQTVLPVFKSRRLCCELNFFVRGHFNRLCNGRRLLKTVVVTLVLITSSLVCRGVSLKIPTYNDGRIEPIHPRTHVGITFITILFWLFLTFTIGNIWNIN